MKPNLLLLCLLFHLILLQSLDPTNARTILLLRHVEQPETESTQFQFNYPDDVDIVGFLRSLCYMKFFQSLSSKHIQIPGVNQPSDLIPKAIVVQTPKHSRRGVESVVPLAYSLKLPIRICCRKYNVSGLVQFVQQIEQEANPVLIVWWGRLMPLIAASFGVPKRQIPHWPNHWSGSSELWTITTPPTSEEVELKVVEMSSCDPEMEREMYCLRSGVWMPGVPRPDEVKKLPPEKKEKDERREVSRQGVVMDQGQRQG